MSALPARLPGSTVSRLLFPGRRVRIGAFRCAPQHPNFAHEGSGAAMAGYDFVFPRTAVWIRHDGSSPFVADTATVTLYNRHQRYQRMPIDARGDLGDWFEVDQELAVEAVSAFEAVDARNEATPFRFPFAPADPQLYARQRLLFEAVRAGRADELMVEETVAELLLHVLRNAYARERDASPAPLSPAQRRLCERARAVLADRYREPIGLDEVARGVGASMFHLARIFHRGTGSTLHSWRTRLRLHAALGEIAAPRWDGDLAAVGVELGFSSHSHFTAVFHRAFGFPPSLLRAWLRQGSLAELERRLALREGGAGVRA